MVNHLTHSTPIRACISTLARYLRRHIKELTVVEEWPYGNQALEYPSVTISSNKPKRMPLIAELVGTSVPDINGLATETWVVAEWDDTFQLDLWTRDKLERDIFLAKILTAFNRQQNSVRGIQNNLADGLSLRLFGYYEDQYARFDIDTTQSIDDEAAAQRQERREKITVLVNTREIRTRTYYAMKVIQIKTQVIDENIDLLDTDDTDVVTVD